MKYLDELKRETENDLNAARERRIDRQSKERRDGPILDAFDRMSRGEAIEHTPGPRHAPRLESVPTPITADTVTDEQIRELRSSAYDAADMRTVRIAMVAENEDNALGRSARAFLARLLNARQANGGK